MFGRKSSHAESIEMYASARLASLKKMGTEYVLTARWVQKSRKQEARTCAVSKQRKIKITTHDVHFPASKALHSAANEHVKFE